MAETTLRAYLKSLTNEKSHAPKFYSRIFNFANDILTISHLPNTFDNLLWCIELSFFDFFVCVICCPFDWFSILTHSLNDSPTLSIFEAKLVLQQLSMLAIAITVLITLFFWVSFLLYNPKINHLTPGHATFLYITAIHVPLILSPINGTLIGSLILSNANGATAEYTTNGICISTGIFHILFLTINAVFTIVTNYSLTLRTGQFAYWRHPFQILDYTILFLIALFFPIRMSFDSQVATIIAVIQFGYGVYLLITLRNITFVSLIALTIQIKIAVDCIIFSVFTVFNLWISYSIIISFSIFVIISFVGTCFSLIILGLIFNYSQTKLASFVQTKMPSAKGAVAMLRFGINLSMKGVTRPEVIKWVALWRFSFDLVPDIVRICIATRRSMDEILIPVVHCGTFKQIPLMFLAFQVEIFEKYMAEDDDPRVIQVCDDLKKSIERIQTVLSNFLIDPIYDQLSLRRLGARVQMNANKFTTATVTYPHSKAVVYLWKRFSNEIMHIEDPLSIHRNNPFEMFYDAKNALFGFLVKTNNEPSDTRSRHNSLHHQSTVSSLGTSFHSQSQSLDYQNTENNTPSREPQLLFQRSQPIVNSLLEENASPLTLTRINESNQINKNNDAIIRSLFFDKESSIDLYFKKEITQYSLPMVVFFYIFYIAFVLVVCILGSFITGQAKIQIDHFINASTFVRLQTELSNEKLAEIEPYVLLPSYRDISRLLGIDEDTATDFVSRRILSRSTFGNLTSLYSYISSFPLPEDTEQCKEISFALLLKYTLPKDSSLDAVYCQMLYINFYSQYIANISQSVIGDISIEYRIGSVSILVFVLIFMGISTLIFILLFIYETKKRRLIIKAMKSVIQQQKQTSKKSNSICYIHYEIEKTITFYSIMWILILAAIVVLDISLEIPARNENNKMTRLLSQISIVSGISRSSQNALAYSSSHFMHNLTIPDNLGYAADSQAELVRQVNLLSDLGIDEIYQDIYPLNKWRADGEESFSSLILDYAQLLSNTASPNDFEFYYARYLFIYNISILIESTLPQMVQTAQLSFQQISSIFLIVSVVILIFIAICLYFFFIEYREKQLWYIAAFCFLRKSIFDDYRNLFIIQKILSKSLFNHLEKIPLAIIVRKKNGPIIYSNSKAGDFIGMSSNQIIGQKLENIFNIENDSSYCKAYVKTPNNNGTLSTDNINELDSEKEIIIHLDMKPVDNENEVIFITDVTDIIQKREIYQNILSQMRPNIPSFPLREKMIYIEITIDTMKANSEKTLDLFDEAERYFQQAIRITCGISFYTALVPANCDYNKLLFYLSTIISESNGHFIIAAVYGQISCTSIDDDETRVVVSGQIANRAHDCICLGVWGRAYVDEIIATHFINTDNEFLLQCDDKSPQEISLLKNLIIIGPLDSPYQ